MIIKIKTTAAMMINDDVDDSCDDDEGYSDDQNIQSFVKQ